MLHPGAATRISYCKIRVASTANANASRPLYSVMVRSCVRSWIQAIWSHCTISVIRDPIKRAATARMIIRLAASQRRVPRFTPHNVDALSQRGHGIVNITLVFEYGGPVEIHLIKCGTES